MRLLLVSQDFPPATGGIQTYAGELARHLASRAEAVHVVAPRHGPWRAVDETLAATVHRIPGTSDTLGVAAIGPIVALARRHRLDTALHAQWTSAAGSLLGRRLGWPRRVFVTTHGRELRLAPLGRRGPAARAFSALRASILRAADGVLAVSRFTAELVGGLGVAPERIHVVPNGTDPERFAAARDGARSTALRRELGPGADGPVLLTVARLVPHKGIDTALHAVARLARRHPRLVYVVVGTGPDEPRLRELADRLGIARRVVFAGHVPDADLPAWLGSADAFVLLSREQGPSVEGFGIAMLEANAAGCPVVAARTGGIPDAVVDGRTGWLVPPDDAHAAAAAIEALLDDPGAARAMGEAGRDRVHTELTWAHAADRVHAVLTGG